MQPCETVGCGKWVAYGQYCAKHEPTPTPTKQAKPKGFVHANREHRAGIPAIDATEVRVTLRPRVTQIKPWSHVRGGTTALSDCVVTRADGTQYTIPKNKRKRAESEHKPVRTSKVDTSAYADRLRKFGAVGNNADA